MDGETTAGVTAQGPLSPENTTVPQGESSGERVLEKTSPGGWDFGKKYGIDAMMCCPNI